MPCPVAHALCVLLLVAASSSKNLKVAWLSPRAEYGGYRAASSMGGLALGVERVQADSTVLQGDTFSVMWRDSNCSSQAAIAAIFQVLIETSWDPDVIVGPPCSAGMQYIGELGGFRNLPVVGWVSDSPSLADKTSYNTLIRVLPPLSGIGEGLMTLLERYQWRRVFLVATQDAHNHALGRGVDRAITARAATNYTLVRDVQGVEQGADQDRIQPILSNLQQEARVAILCMSRDDLRTWLLVARDMGMTYKDYVFIYVNGELPTDDVMGEFLSDKLWKKSDGKDAKAKKAFESLLIFTAETLTIDTTAYNKNSYAMANTAIWQNNIGLVPDQSDVYSPFLHDAVRLYALLADEVGAAYRNGTLLLDRARSRIISGPEFVTGRVVLDEQGDRRPEFWVLDLQHGDGRFAAALKTDTAVTGRQLLVTMTEVTEITWADGSQGDANAPTDVPRCGFQNEKCPDLPLIVSVPVVLFVLIVVGLIVFFVNRRMQFERSLQDMVWKLNHDDLNTEKKGHGADGSALLRLSHASRTLSFLHTSATHVGSHGTKQNQSEDRSSMLSGEGQIFIRTATLKGATVAVKPVRKLRIKLDRDLLVEMRHMVDAKHQNLNSFIGAAVEPPDICEVWEYCTKGSLQDVIWNENIKLDDMFKFSIVIDMLKGLKYLHDRPLRFHGSLRSSNCVIDGRWVCKLTDYGLRNLRQGATPDPDISEHKLYSYLQWTAPEQLREAAGSAAGPGSQEADVYAAAVILKEVFARNGPYEELDEEPQDVIANVRAEPRPGGAPYRPPLNEVKGKVSDRLLDAIRSGWREKAADRPTAAGLLRDVQRNNPFKSTNVMDNMVKMMERYSTSLEEMVAERTQQVDEEKLKSEQLLFRMLPRPIAEELKMGRTVQAESFDSVSIYFSDIVKFTNLSAASTPMQVVDLLNDLYTVFDEAIEAHDVYKVETIGDAYMLVSGLPVRNAERHPVEITNAAMDLLSGVMNFRVRHMPEYQLRLRIGLHTGPAVAGVVGVSMPRYCLFGNTVSAASLMESGGMPMSVHISQHLYSGLSKFAGYHLAERGSTMDVKGLGNIKTYFIVKQDGYTKPYPDFAEMSKDEDPKPKYLPVTRGKKLRDEVTARPSVESGIYDVDSDSDYMSRKTSTVEDVSKLGDIRENSEENVKKASVDESSSPEGAVVEKDDAHARGRRTDGRKDGIQPGAGDAAGEWQFKRSQAPGEREEAAGGEDSPAQGIPDIAVEDFH